MINHYLRNIFDKRHNLLTIKKYIIEDKIEVKELKQKKAQDNNREHYEEDEAEERVELDDQSLSEEYVQQET